LQHHEHWDGSGYPKGLKGNEIHLYSRILAIADAYEAMTSPRPYRGPLSHEEAIKELKKNSGLQFDPRLVDIFISLIEEHPQNKI
jgi:HD-GYP domain-containing protein (c-di-GMP phosphodiesterase class II)